MENPGRKVSPIINHRNKPDKVIMTNEKITYNEAVAEIEEILGKIEDGELDVDELTAGVRRVTHLLKVCRDKLHKTEEEVNKILEDDD